jgi:hypothetical protein
MPEAAVERFTLRAVFLGGRLLPGGLHTPLALNLQALATKA